MISDPLLMGKISYINASPVYYGLDHGLKPDWLTLVPEVPSVLNRRIITGDIHISPISSAFYALNHSDLLLLPDFSISCHGSVMSVICASQYPLDDLTGKTILFSNESASAASFLKMIFSQKQVRPRFLAGPAGDIDNIPTDVDAVLVIGDAALTQAWDKRFPYCYDLGDVWYDMTGLPFVFAVWVVRKDYAAAHPQRVSRALALLRESRDQGDIHMDEIIADGQARLGLGRDRVEAYYDLLHCDLDAQKQTAMIRFFDSLFEEGILAEKARLSFFSPQ